MCVSISWVGIKGKRRSESSVANLRPIRCTSHVEKVNPSLCVMVVKNISHNHTRTQDSFFLHFILQKDVCLLTHQRHARVHVQHNSVTQAHGIYGIPYPSYFSSPKAEGRFKGITCFYAVRISLTICQKVCLNFPIYRKTIMPRVC